MTTRRWSRPYIHSLTRCCPVCLWGLFADMSQCNPGPRLRRRKCTTRYFNPSYCYFNINFTTVGKHSESNKNIGVGWFSLNSSKRPSSSYKQSIGSRSTILRLQYWPNTHTRLNTGEDWIRPDIGSVYCQPNPAL